MTQALGSRRYQVVVTGPGGHSFSDAGTPNPIAALAQALASLAETSLPDEPRTTLNLGTISGGISVNSIPESAQASIDFRSTSHEQLVRLEVVLHRAVEDAVEHWNAKARAFKTGRFREPLAFSILSISATVLPRDCRRIQRSLRTLRAVDRHLGLPTDVRLGSTDANLPLSLGVPALSMGAGGEGGAAHTLHEWYSPKDREIALKRILLLTLAMLGLGRGTITNLGQRRKSCLCYNSAHARLLGNHPFSFCRRTVLFAISRDSYSDASRSRPRPYFSERRDLHRGRFQRG